MRLTDGLAMGDQVLQDWIKIGIDRLVHVQEPDIP
jgi:hypothetical protein